LIGQLANLRFAIPGDDHHVPELVLRPQVSPKRTTLRAWPIAKAKAGGVAMIDQHHAVAAILLHHILRFRAPARRPGSSARGSIHPAGSRTRISVYVFPSLSAEISPFIRAKSPLALKSPRPKFSSSFRVVKNGSKTRGITGGLMPCQSSWNLTSTNAELVATLTTVDFAFASLAFRKISFNFRQSARTFSRPSNCFLVRRLGEYSSDSNNSDTLTDSGRSGTALLTTAASSI
jgi:hypothetical protein